MSDPSAFDWCATSAEAQLAHIRSLAPERRKAALCFYDWAHHPETVLGWAMAQKGIDLGIAVQVFFNGGPQRFNYLPKPQVPEAYRGTTRVLDTICQRINSGFYLVYPTLAPTCRKEALTWLSYQRADQAEGRSGRWVLDETILDPILSETRRPAATPETRKARNHSLLRDLMSPVIGLGVDRDILKYRDKTD
ncbi:MAG: hypothetical protein COW54_12160 [Rhodobacteraceae bacterium CG17_big_fil_post_rev_8_21_14_2_50_63_15]|nr:hypothetical protein [Roseovarius sp.]PIV77904.1 MAG: hypothetical protein COW54_12160 [Rhodobacteraceae bacterium CG17_big_fil_post_rev_8_21_14_2_50_63_15]